VTSGKGIIAGQIEQMFNVACRKAGIADQSPTLSIMSFRRPTGNQLSLFT